MMCGSFTKLKCQIVIARLKKKIVGHDKGHHVRFLVCLAS